MLIGRIVYASLNLPAKLPDNVEHKKLEKPVQQRFWIHLVQFGSSVVRALAMLAGDPGSIPGHTTNFSNFSEGIGKPL